MVPRGLLPAAVDYCFQPGHAEFAPRTAWSSYKSARETLKSLSPVPTFHRAAPVGRFFETRLKSSKWGMSIRCGAHTAIRESRSFRSSAFWVDRP